MKIKGEKIEGPNVEYIPIPRGTSDDIILKARAVLDSSAFEKQCPAPEPPKRKISGKDIPVLNDRDYLAACEARSERKLAWMIMESLKETEGLEWETVDPDDFTTWTNVKSELKSAGFSEIEIQRIIGGVVSVNALNQDKVDDALKRFLLQQQVQAEE